MADWIFQDNPRHYDLDAAVTAYREQWWGTPRYRDRMAVASLDQRLDSRQLSRAELPEAQALFARPPRSRLCRAQDHPNTL